MPAQETPEVSTTPGATPPPSEENGIHLKSVQRISSLPGISSGISLTTGLYGKVKESNPVCRFLFQSAENTVNKAAQLAEPVTNVFEKPINFVDSTFCSTMDVVESTIPVVIEAPQKLCSRAANIVPVQPAVDCVKAVSNYGVQSVNQIFGKVQDTSSATPASETQTTQDENESETEREMQGQYNQTGAASGNVKNIAKAFQ